MNLKRNLNKGKQCADPGCEKPAYSRGLCVAHYERIRRNGYEENDGVGHEVHDGDYQSHVNRIAREILLADLNLRMSDWTIKNFRLPQSEGVDGGKLTWDGYAHVPVIMDYIQRPGTRCIILCCSSQSGKTVILLASSAYFAGAKGWTGLYALPTMKLQQKLPKTRMVPSYERSSCAWGRREGMVLRFESGAYIWVALMSSPDSLAEMPARWVIADELDECERWDTDPVELMENRLTTARNPKMILSSTPKLVSEQGIYHRYNESRRHILEMQCPHCDDWFWSRFPDHFKWPDGVHPEKIMDDKLGWIECPACSGKITDADHWDIVNNRQRVKCLDPEKPESVVGFHIRRWETKWKTYSEVIAKYLTVKDDESKLRDFWNSWCAEPRDMEIRGIQINYDRLKGEFSRELQQIPHWVQFVTGGADVGKGEVWLTLTGWGSENRAVCFWSVKLVSHHGHDTTGNADILENMRKACLMEHFKFLGEGAIRHPIFVGGCIDARYNTEDVYEFCRNNPEWMPVFGKGTGNRLWTKSKADPENEHKGRFRGLECLNHQTHQLQEVLQIRLEKEIGDAGSIEFASDEGSRIFEHLKAVVRREKIVKGRLVVEWTKRSSHSRDHLRDALANGELCGRYLGLTRLDKQEESRPKQTESGSRRDNPDNFYNNHNEGFQQERM